MPLASTVNVFEHDPISKGVKPTSISIVTVGGISNTGAETTEKSVQPVGSNSNFVIVIGKGEVLVMLTGIVLVDPIPCWFLHRG